MASGFPCVAYEFGGMDRERRPPKPCPQRLSLLTVVVSAIGIGRRQVPHPGPLLKERELGGITDFQVRIGSQDSPAGSFASLVSDRLLKTQVAAGF